MLQYKKDINPEGDLYPLLLYIYGDEGLNQGSIRLNNEVALAYAFRTSIKYAIENKREVRITDTGDLLCFHARDGKILYDGIKHYE